VRSVEHLVSFTNVKKLVLVQSKVEELHKLMVE
jgi:hypothetical protein